MSEYIKHIIKYDYQDGVKLPTPVLWCKSPSMWGEWYFQDVQHAALTVCHEGRLVPCKDCCNEVIKYLGSVNES
ncbi:MAG: hypothetical protein [Caudoviricetes sp.]|nr:MAG: hypothetical protein [Caudoviricetes sp.]